MGSAGASALRRLPLVAELGLGLVRVSADPGPDAGPAGPRNGASIGEPLAVHGANIEDLSFAVAREGAALCAADAEAKAEVPACAIRPAGGARE